MQITIKNLEAQAGHISKALGYPESGPGSLFISQGTYFRLVQRSSPTGETNILVAKTKKELSDKMFAYIDGIYTAQRQQSPRNAQFK